MNMMMMTTTTLVTMEMTMVKTLKLKMVNPHQILILTMNPGRMKPHRASRRRTRSTRKEIRARARRWEKDPPSETRVVRRTGSRSQSPASHPTSNSRQSSPDSRTVSLLRSDGRWTEDRAGSGSSFSLLQRPSPPQSLKSSSFPSLTSLNQSNFLTNDTTSSDEDSEDNQELSIPSYQELCYHITLRHIHDLQQGLLQNRSCPDQEEDLLLANLALEKVPARFPVLKTSCIVLRGEDRASHPLQIPLWVQGGPGKEEKQSRKKAFGSQLTGQLSTDKRRSRFKLTKE